MNNPFDGHFLLWQIGNDPIAQPANTAANVWPRLPKDPSLPRLGCQLMYSLHQSPSSKVQKCLPELTEATTDLTMGV